MITIPAWAVLALILAVVVFGWLAGHWRSRCARLAADVAAVQQRAQRARLEGCTNGWHEGTRNAERRTWGMCYQAALIATREERDVLQAIAALGPIEQEREVGA